MAAVDALALFTGELAGDDIRDKKVTVSKMKYVAKAMGAAKVKTELLPYLMQFIDTCDEDELLAEVATEIGQLLTLVDSKIDLLPPLLKLCKKDETKVREAAVPALAAVGDSMDAGEINEAFHPLVKGLINEPWWTCKVSAAGLIAASYPKAAPDAQTELRQMVGQLTKDETPMVRRSLAANFGKFFHALQPEVQAEVQPHFTKLQKDDQDSVRILLLGSCLFACKAQSSACESWFYPAIEQFAKDDSWRVRLEVTKLLSELAECAAGIKTLPMLQAFLDDPEIDVRRFALDHVPAVLKKHEDAAETTGILESIKQLVGLDMETPNALPLKTTLAKIVVELAAGLGKTVAKTHILPIIVSLLEEEAIEVRIAVVENLPELVRVVGGDALTEKVSLAVLAGDSSWRVRMSYISTVHLIAASLNAANDRAQFDSSILPACKEIVLKDGIASVRQAGAKMLSELHVVFGDEFSTTVSGPTIKALAEIPNYLHRITATQAICFLGEVGCKSISRTMADVAMLLCTDKVINVRFNAAAACGAVAKVDKALAAELKPVLTKMLDDEDPDCIAYAADALAFC